MLISEYMGEKSSVTINTPGKASLKTTIPISMVRQFGINQGDQLDWSVAKFGDNELVMVVRKEGQKLEQNIIPYNVIEEEREKNKREIKGDKKDHSVQLWLSKEMSSEIDRNVCKICGEKAIAGILDNYDNNDDSNNQTRIRYSCHNHYLQVYKKIKEERKNQK